MSALVAMEGIRSTAENPEQVASRKLERLIDEYPFLVNHPQTRALIESAESEVAALAIAEAKVAARLDRTFRFRAAGSAEDTSQIEVAGVKRIFREIRQRSRSIGEGGDAEVFVAEIEKYNDVYEICYKVAKLEALHKGRNTTEQELDMQVAFYEALSSVEDISVGVPEPYYFAELGADKVIAMKRLPARSIDDMRRGKATLPAWCTEAHIDRFCDDLHRALDVLHSVGLYHRDLHYGNIMFSAEPEEPEKLGYIIDFGVSSFGVEGLDPYRSEARGEVFTYDDDYGRIEGVRNELKRQLWSRK